MPGAWPSIGPSKARPNSVGRSPSVFTSWSASALKYSAARSCMPPPAVGAYVRIAGRLGSIGFPSSASFT